MASSSTSPSEVELLYSGKARIGRQQYALRLTASELDWTPFGEAKAAGLFRLDDIYAAELAPLNGEFGFVVFALLEKKPRKRSKTGQRFVTSTAEEALEWVDAVRSVINGVAIGVAPKRRRVLVLINPVGGIRQAVPTFRNFVAPLFEKAQVDAKVILTTHAHHATEIGRDLDLTSCDAVITVSGDGLLHELINGLLSRPDWDQARNMPLGLIPAGSGNGLARSFDIRDVNAATLCVIKGVTRRLDILATYQGTTRRFSHLGLYFGIFADVDIESDKYRWAGPARFTFSAIARLLNLRKPRARLSYVPMDEPSSVSEVACTEPGPPTKYLDPANLHPPGWKTVEASFVNVLVMNLSWAAQDMLVAPYAAMDDGCMQLIFIRSDHPRLTRPKLIAMLLDQEDGESVLQPFVESVRVKAFTLEPLDERGIVDIDGELVDFAPISIENIPQTLNFLVPKGLQESPWLWRDRKQ